MQAVPADRVRVEVSDRKAAADWYGRVLGLRGHAPLASWEEDFMGHSFWKALTGIPRCHFFTRDFKELSHDTPIAFRVIGQEFCPKFE